MPPPDAGISCARRITAQAMRAGLFATATATTKLPPADDPRIGVGRFERSRWLGA